MTIIYFVRHGKTDFSGKRLQGNIPGIHINDEGKLQATRVAAYLENTNLHSIYSSPLERTLETAEFIAKKHNLAVSTADFLKEIDFGVFQGKGKELLNDTLWQSFLTKPSRMRFPQGESPREAQRRMVKGLNDLVDNLVVNDEIVCVAHCEVIRLAIAHALSIPLDAYMKLSVDPASISKVIWDSQRKEVLSLNLHP